MPPIDCSRLLSTRRAAGNEQVRTPTMQQGTRGATTYTWHVRGAPVRAVVHCPATTERQIDTGEQA